MTNLKNSEGKEASYYKKLGDKEVQCQLCPHSCYLKNEQYGKCHSRKNINGKLISLVYGKPCSYAIEPIEKKPLYHFLPGKRILSVATSGCNLSCGFCQNFEISQCSAEKIKTLNVSAEEIAKGAKNKNLDMIAYTYTEPTIFFEYMLDIAKSAKKNKIKNVTVTNGFINPAPLKELCKYLDASNIDLKSIDDEFYRRICSARLEPVQNSIKIMKEKGIWIELTNLIIPGLNDSISDINKLVDWIKKNLGKDIPLHFSAFHPNYKILKLPPTSLETLRRARRIAMAKGLNYVYIGNEDEEGNNTYCPKCKSILIRRKYYQIIEYKIVNGKCYKCKQDIAGVWD